MKNGVPHGYGVAVKGTTVYGDIYHQGTWRNGKPIRIVTDMTLKEFREALNDSLESVGISERINRFKVENLSEYGLSGVVYTYDFGSEISLVVELKNNRVREIALQETSNTSIYPSDEVMDIQTAVMMASNKITNVQTVQNLLSQVMTPVYYGLSGTIEKNGLKYALTMQSIPELPMSVYAFAISKAD